jgi:phosphoribosylaminoimidazolecarboxamide formyltransferase/IMP cyclohydrolase
MKALISVYNKDGVLEFARFLVGAGWQLVSTGGTAEYLRKNGLAIQDVSELTGFPECLDGRIKTLHPAVHAGILARRGEKSHVQALENLKIDAIDLVCVNLYPFSEKVRENLSEDDTVEFIDIGGPTMLRSAAKNFKDVLVVTDTADYRPLMEAMKAGKIPETLRRHLAGKVFGLTSAFDAAVAHYLLGEDLPEYWNEALRKKFPLRYGENSHQKSAFYIHTDRQGAFSDMEILGGKELSYNNIRDVDTAWKVACAYGLPAEHALPFGRKDSAKILPDVAFTQRASCAAVKHNTPCGIALGKTLEEAYTKTFLCDPISIFGGIVASNMTITAAVAEKIAGLFLEIIIAPDFEPAALDILRQKKDLRIIQAKRAPQEHFEVTSVDGGLLVQEVNRHLLKKWDVVTTLAPERRFIHDMLFGLRAVNWVKSNAIVIVKDCAAVGIGGGETNRIWAAELALNRAAKTVATAAETAASAERGGKADAPDTPYGKIFIRDMPSAFSDAEPARVLASDAFFPFPDVVELAAAAGIKAIIQSGGSNNDKLSVEACNDLGIAMVFTGARYFRH